MAKLTIEDVARVSHEANRAYCLALGDTSQAPWDEAPAWQRESAVNGVAFHVANPDAGDSASHDNWRREKEAGGWIYGPEKNPQTMEHPCMVDFADLPVEQQIKDTLFRSVVHALRGGLS